MAILGMLGAMAVWCSHPAIFILGGIGLTLVFSNLCAGQWRRSMAWSLTMACCATSFAIAYLSVYQHAAHSDYLLNYWKDTLAPIPPRSLGDVKWYIDSSFALFKFPLGLKTPSNWRGPDALRRIGALEARPGAVVRVPRGASTAHAARVESASVSVLATADAVLHAASRSLVAAGIDGIGLFLGNRSSPYETSSLLYAPSLSLLPRGEVRVEPASIRVHYDVKPGAVSRVIDRVQSGGHDLPQLGSQQSR